MKSESAAPPVLDLSSAAGVLSELEIVSIQIEDWAILQKSKFDVCVDDDPFSAVQVFVNLATLEYSLRVWGRTLERGHIGQGESDGGSTGLGDLCRAAFGPDVAFCPGLPMEDADGQQSGGGLLCVDYPYRRIVSAGCEIMYNYDPDSADSQQPCRLCASCEEASADAEEPLDEVAVTDFAQVKMEERVDNSVVDDGPEVYDSGGNDEDKEEDWSSGSEQEDEEDKDFKPKIAIGKGKRRKASGSDLDDEDYEEEGTGRKRRKLSRPVDPNAAFPCSVCGKSMSSQRRLDFHEARHRGEKPFKCPFQDCTKSFKHKETHLKVKVLYPFWKGRKRDEKFQCAFCDLQINLSKARRHAMERHLYRKYRCDAGCGVVGTVPSEFVAHVAANHPTEIKTAKCFFCKESVPLKIEGGGDDGDFEAHMYACCAKIYRERYLIGRAAEKSKSHMCDLCGRNMSTAAALLTHRKRHSNERPFKCQEPGCSEGFVTAQNLQKHSYTHMRKKGLITPDDAQCELCGVYLSSKSALQKHVSVVHEKKITRSKCKLCDEVFTNRTSCQTHMNRVHFPDKFRCPECGKVNGSAHALRQHMLYHGDPQFECDVCGKRVRNRVVLEDHKRLHTGEKPFSCELCNYRCQSGAMLHHHKRFTHKEQHQARQIEKLRVKMEANSC